MASYLLLFKYDPDGVCIDSMLDVSEAIGRGSLRDIVTAEKVAARLTGEPMELKIVSLLQACNMIQLRSRLDGGCDGPYLVHLDTDVTRDELEDLLRSDKKLLKKVRGQMFR